jgi:adenylate cyclase
MILITTLIVAVLPFTGAGLSAAFGAVATAAMLLGSWIAFSRYGFLLDPVFPMLTGAAIFLLTTLLLYAVTEREKRFVRGAFQRYLAPDLLKKLEEHPETLRLGGEIREMTLMFMDVRGFTPISERLQPEELVNFLNKLLSPLSEAILAREGAIDKYIGDSIMAFWNAPLAVEDHPIKAARAALEMIEIVGKLNAADQFGFHKPEIGLGNVQIGIGLNTGLGCVGNMGSASRFDYSVVGDTVNVAARIESSCKAIGWPILLSETTAEHCAGLAFLEAGEIALKGKSRPAKLFALIGDEKLAETPDWKTLLIRHAQLMKAIRAGRRANFSGLKRDCLAIAPPGLEHFYGQLTDRAGELAAAE